MKRVLQSTSIIIPTYKGSIYLKRLVPALLAQTSPPDEILIIDSSSYDGTEEIARRYGCRFHVIQQKDFSHGGTRNLGTRLARGEVLVFMTQDALPFDATTLECLLRPLKSEQIAATYARQVPYEDASPLERFLRATNYPPVSKVYSQVDAGPSSIKSFLFSNVTSAVKREYFEKVGGFPLSIIQNEDMLLSAKLQRIGLSVKYTAEAKVLHSHNYSLLQQFRRYFDIGAALSQSRLELGVHASGGDGLRFVRGQLLHLIAEGEWLWFPHACGEAAGKFLGYQLGLRAKNLPIALRLACSMHRGFWLQAPDHGALMNEYAQPSGEKAASASHGR